MFRLVKEVAYDMIPFGGFCLLCLLMIGTTMYHLDTEEKINGEGEYDISEVKPMYSYVLEIYLICFGEYSLDNYGKNPYQYALFMGTTIVLSLIMLNLLIAIMSDTFEKVMSESDISEGIELNNLILDAESIMIRQRKIKKRSYLNWVEYKSDEGDQQWEGRTNVVQSAISATEK